MLSFNLVQGLRKWWMKTLLKLKKKETKKYFSFSILEAYNFLFVCNFLISNLFGNCSLKNKEVIAHLKKIIFLRSLWFFENENVPDVLEFNS